MDNIKVRSSSLVIDIYVSHDKLLNANIYEVICLVSILLVGVTSGRTGVKIRAATMTSKVESMNKFVFTPGASLCPYTKAYDTG